MGKATAPGGRVKALHWLTVGLVAAGVAGRLTRYFLQFPLWGDEAFVCLNCLGRDYLGLTRGLEYSQVAPVLFLWSQLAVFRLLGTSELAARLPALLAGLASLALFWRLARSTTPPLTAALAVGLLAVARWPVSMCTFAKPYSFDLLAALLLLVPAAEWLRRPERLRWPALLAAATPFALLASYPAVFVAGAVSAALLPTAWRSGRGGRALFVGYNLLMSAAFLGSYWAVGRRQLDPVAGSVGAYLQSYWADAFPPASPWPLAKWLTLIHAGRMMAYPVGGSNGASAGTLLLFAAGVWTWWRSRRRPLLVLWLAPFALNLLAAALRRYPYGGCCRLSQHLAPAVCILAATGATALLERFVRPGASRLRWVAVAAGLLGACAAGGIICDVVWPYHDPDAAWLRDTAEAILSRAGPKDQVVVAQGKYAVLSEFRWYLESRDPRVRWDGRIDWEQLDAGQGALWTVDFRQEGGGGDLGDPSPNDGGAAAAQPADGPESHGWKLASRTPLASRGGRGGPIFHCDLCRWVFPYKRE